MSATLKYQPRLGCAMESGDQGAPRSSGKRRLAAGACQLAFAGACVWGARRPVPSGYVIAGRWSRPMRCCRRRSRNWCTGRAISV